MPSPRRLFPICYLSSILVACSSATTTDPAPGPAPASASAASRAPSSSARLGIPPGHLPPPGSCRVWVPGKPPGHQAKAGSCQALLRTAPPGSWLVYRPTKDRKVVHVREIDSQRPGVVIRERVFDVATGMVVQSDDR